MADSLTYDGFDDVVTVSPGQIVGTGALTYAAIVKIVDGWWNAMIHYNALSGQGFQIRADTQKLAYVLGALFCDSTFTVTAAEGWVLVAYSKPAGSAAGTHHKYVYGTGAWTHTAGSVAIASPPAPTVIHFGGNPTDGDFFNGSQLLTAIWDRELSNVEVEALSPGLKQWIQAGPKEAWRFDSISPLRSQITTSAQTARTGTTLNPGDVPTGWTDSLNPAILDGVRRAAFPFIPRGDRLIESGLPTNATRQTGGPRPAGGFERFIFPRLHPVPSTEYTADVSDSVTPSDAVALTFTLAIADSTTLADAAVRTTTKAIADTATPSDAATRTVTITKADSVTVIDSSAEGTTVATSDSVTPTDAAASSVTIAKADTVGVADAAATTATYDRQIADSATLADAATRSVDHAESDSVSLADAATRSFTLVLSDSATVADSAAEGPELSTSDTVTPTDAATRDVTKAVSDSAAPADALTTSAELVLSDSAATADAVAKTVTLALSDSTTLSDATEAANELTASPSDSTTVSDAITFTITTALADSVTLTDASADGVTLAISDTVTVSDSATPQIVTPFEIDDSVTVTDSFSGTIAPSAPECMGVPVEMVRELTLQLADRVRVRDSFLPGPPVEDEILAEDDEFARLWLLELV